MRQVPHGRKTRNMATHDTPWSLAYSFLSEVYVVLGIGAFIFAEQRVEGRMSGCFPSSFYRHQLVSLI